MSVDRLSNSPVSISEPLRVGQGREGLEQLKSAELAREFESMLLLQMLRQMRQSALDDTGEDEGLSADTMIDTVDAELARQLSKAGGLGLADVMIKAIQGRAASTPGDATAAGAVTAAMSLQPTAKMEVNVPGLTGLKAGNADVEITGVAGFAEKRLTSEYGWRTDPFTGAARYHRGVDLKAAYGEDVPTAGDGRVVEAGNQGPYGLTVLVDHGNGVKTRYAHLSAITVEAGDRVLQGQEIGRVGQTGRATGPHLHFEVVRNGQRIDPSQVVALRGSGLGGLKLTGAVADSPIGGQALVSATSGVDDED